MRYDAGVTAKQGVDQCALTRVQEWDGESAKVAKRPEQINALHERKFNPNQSLLCFEQQEAGLESVQKHGYAQDQTP
jgi:hypothetical protein